MCKILLLVLFTPIPNTQSYIQTKYNLHDKMSRLYCSSISFPIDLLTWQKLLTLTLILNAHRNHNTLNIIDSVNTVDCLINEILVWTFMNLGMLIACFSYDIDVFDCFVLAIKNFALHNLSKNLTWLVIHFKASC